MKRFLSLFLTISILFACASFIAAESSYHVLLKPGDSGEAVLNLQTKLYDLGYTMTETDGIYGNGTEEAVRRFQLINGLLVTGIADQTTQTVLFSNHAVSNENTTDVLVEVEETVDGYSLPGMNLYAAMSTSMPFAAGKSSPILEFNRDSYAMISENVFHSVYASPFSTFAADIDTSSYAQVRSRILQGKPVPKDSVRTEEVLNYFRYDGTSPEGSDPFGITFELTNCPWNTETKLLRVLLTAKEVPDNERTPRHLVFLIDTSGSMSGEDRIDLVKRAFLMLLENMDAKDHVSIVTYASREETVAEYVSAGDKTRLMEAISDLEASGYTNGSAGLIRAYELADRYASEGTNTRILLATDGDLNVGLTSEGDLARLVMEKKRSGTNLTVLGFGYGNYQDDRLQALANYGDGNCYYIDTIYEARKALITEAGGTFDLVASDVKIQLDFNPAKVSGYRLIGYENKLLNAEDFVNDEKDGGDIGSGQQMTALYEIVPVGSEFDFGEVESKYSKQSVPDNDTEWLTLNLRAKVPGKTDSQLYTYPLAGEVKETMSADSLFAAAAAEVCMVLRNSEHIGTSSYSSALQLLRASNPSGDPYKEEFVYLVTLLERAM